MVSVLAREDRAMHKKLKVTSTTSWGRLIPKLMDLSVAVRHNIEVSEPKLVMKRC